MGHILWGEQIAYSGDDGGNGSGSKRDIKELSDVNYNVPFARKLPLLFSSVVLLLPDKLEARKKCSVQIYIHSPYFIGIFTRFTPIQLIIPNRMFAQIFVTAMEKMNLDR